MLDYQCRKVYYVEQYQPKIVTNNGNNAKLIDNKDE